MSRNAKVSAALVAFFVGIVAVIGLAVGGGDDDPPSPAPSAASTTSATSGADAAGVPRVVASDPRRLGPPGRSGVTFTEFLDFECESCAAVFPAIEQLRREYEGRVTFNIRYFPLDGHRNARNAAHAVEAAAQQGKLEAMYQRMYETQPSWGEQEDSKAAVFRGFAEDLGLDLRAYDAAVADPKTAARVERDFQAGLELGVQGTPTFFIDEQRINPETLDELRQQLDEAIAGS
jgi:protein-disulfide isomerase